MKEILIGTVLMAGLMKLTHRRGPILMTISLLQHAAAVWRWIRCEAIPAVGRVRGRYWECLQEVRSR